MEALFRLIKQMVKPAVWSAGVELARNADFHLMSGQLQEDELTLRIVRGARDTVTTVSLSERDEVWQCDCDLDEDPCRHVVAAIIAAKQERVTTSTHRRSSADLGLLVHSLATIGDAVRFERYVKFGSERVSVAGTLIQTIAALKSHGKIVDASDAELRIDHVLPPSRSDVRDHKTMRYLIPALSRVRYLELDGSEITSSPEVRVLGIELVDSVGGYHLRRIADKHLTRVFDNGVAIYDGRLCAIEDSALRMEELALLRGEGTFFPLSKGVELATRIVPSLQGRAAVSIRSTTLPRARRIAPRIMIETVAAANGEVLTVIPQLVYGDPAIARIRGTEMELVDVREIPIRDLVEESKLSRELNLRMGLRVGQATAFAGYEALRIAQRLQGWDTTGEGVSHFTPTEEVRPVAYAVAGSLDISFKSRSGASIPLSDVIKSWKNGASAVRLPDGSGWAALPRHWLAKHGESLERLLAARELDKSIPARMIEEVCDVCDSLGVDPPDYFARLKSGLERYETIPDVALPADLTATLRSYQRVGVNWLSFLNTHGLGALLADDMGLGKTLQTLCVVHGRTLVVCPTSVVSSWCEQIKRFRPQLSVSTYQGPNRSLALQADIIVTSYAILRLDREELCEKSWDTLVLDEAQTIRNPDSQVAQAAYSLKATNRISLSGTPVENSLEDLWSQSNVLNPGLLGTRAEFIHMYSQPIMQGDSDKAQALRRRISPFILRRLKRDVATELPPKTEVILECELDEQEKVVYQAILLATRTEILSQSSKAVSALSILEALLRLRQACCHLSLVPGHRADSSSKVDLLLDSLERSLAQGHRALVFSQWTSLLDLIEPHLRAKGIDFCRIDGTTQGRGDIVDNFQSADGPPIMLLSLKAGGLGITLTRADHVYIIDPWWNPAVEDQAADRAYRIGQENPVIVHRLVARDTIEQRVLALQETKRGLLAAAIGEGTASIQFTREEILNLLDG